ncbi:sorbitol/mannitol transport system substrate-binding protein [Octadecabacter temperatus]|uniref:Bacterial extracellular solute-binding protein n=1 Tax=Octadecabacter temperatus TaxID=1458307 RepID=A0A0K0Y464_9RHOB|nr:sugar ABC transporter substrate-binding protein [Octadecabacter temperatus]AKS45763.1 Bacterial extracellular solute-binding protein [Octadecabacter temperatus]SIN99971.1 sorbitol/mannitol transport system substrate-binding protein [Octadecabacter temperatus]
MSIKKTLLTTAVGFGLTAGIAAADGHTSLTIAIVNNGHMINMQTVAEAYTAETGVELNWVSLEEGVLREQVTSDTATGGGQYDIINIGMQEAPIWGAAGWIEPLELSDDYDVGDLLPAMANGLSADGTLYAAPFYGESSMVMYRKDLTDAAGVTIADNDSWENVMAAAAAMHDPDNGVYGACLRGKPGWGDNMAFVTTMVNSFGGAWFDADMKPALDSDEWNAAINFYVELLGTYGPPGSEGNSFNEILALYNEGKCGLWIDATIAASFLEVDGVAYAQSPNAGNPVGANWLWAWAMAVPTGSPNSEAAHAFIEWATSKEYIQAVGNHPDFGWGSVPTGTRASTYEIAEFQAAAPFAAAEMAAIESAAPAATDLKPYVGVQFAAIPEFPEVGTAVAQEIAAALSGAKTVEEALAASQEAADAIMREAGYYE